MVYNVVVMAFYLIGLLLPSNRYIGSIVYVLPVDVGSYN